MHSFSYRSSGEPARLTVQALGNGSMGFDVHTCKGHVMGHMEYGPALQLALCILRMQGYVGHVSREQRVEL